MTSRAKERVQVHGSFWVLPFALLVLFSFDPVKGFSRDSNSEQRRGNVSRGNMDGYMYLGIDCV